MKSNVSIMNNFGRLCQTTAPRTENDAINKKSGVIWGEIQHRQY